MGLAGWIHVASGNAGRDIVVDPGRINFGTNLYKSFAFTVYLFEFEAEPGRAVAFATARLFFFGV